MIIPDLNLLIYAYNEDAPGHAGAKRWWEASLSATRPVGLPWVVLLGFVRLMSNRRVVEVPMPAAEAVQHCKAWLARPNARIILPGPGHLDVLADLLRAGSAGADLITDAHLAALAIEHQAELHSTDRDFARFPGLHWSNPIAKTA
ncbi:TA system VapC family ribonuclease toxin [Thiohalocapsa halophila]